MQQLSFFVTKFVQYRFQHKNYRPGVAWLDSVADQSVLLVVAGVNVVEVVVVVAVKVVAVATD